VPYGSAQYNCYVQRHCPSSASQTLAAVISSQRPLMHLTCLCIKHPCDDMQCISYVIASDLVAVSQQKL
jgi:hypothetical protein